MEKQNLDQHFMIDKELLTRIVNYADLKETDIVLEIGAGKGALTKLLIKKTQVKAIELDSELFKELEKINSENLSLKQGNALSLIKNIHFNKIVANIPYSISEPLIKKILIKQPELVVLTTGINFLSYLDKNELLKLIYDYEVKEKVSRKCFYPQPNTESMILYLKLKNDKIALFFQELLSQHDKKLKNALLKSFENTLTKNETREKIKGFDSLEKSPINISNKDIEELKNIIN
jgi:16S rRNA (adenine1518-N6/adenine1519-N6)-dimethyltransferase